MRTTKTLIGLKAREAVLQGVNAIYQPVRLTFGPEAKKALIFRTMNRGSRIVDDGYFVAESQEPKDPFVRLAANSFKEACKRTNEKVGDGTTGTVIVGGELFNTAYKILTEGHSSFVAKGGRKVGVSTLRKQILESANRIKKAIRDNSKKVESLEDLEKIATVSMGDAEVGKVVAKMAWEVGVDGFIDVVEGYKGELETEVINGFRFPAKVAAKVFVNNPARFEMVMQDIPVLITNSKLDNASDVVTVFQNLQKSTSKIAVIAPSFGENVLVQMVNAHKQGYMIYPIAVPSLRTDQFEDLAIYCKATFIDKNKGKLLRNVKPEDMGFVEKLVVKDTEAKEDAVATGGRGTQEETISEVKLGEDGKKEFVEKRSTAIAERILTLKGQLLETKEENYKKLLERRIASMASAVGIIRVGDTTQAASLSTKLKIEDTVYACRSALRSGYVKGGGLCLKEIADTLPEDDIMKAAITAPYDQLQASVDGGLEIGEDIIDPADAIYFAIEHASAVVANLITVEILTPEAEDPIHGEGEFAMARAIGEVSLALRRHFGQINENEEEMKRDQMHSMLTDEKLSTDELVTLSNVTELPR